MPVMRRGASAQRRTAYGCSRFREGVRYVLISRNIQDATRAGCVTRLKEEFFKEADEVAVA